MSFRSMTSLPGYEVQDLGTDSEFAEFIRPGGHFKFPHPWPGQIPPVDSGRTM
jgi:hypothetical protein